MDSLAASRRAAEHHALAVAAGPPRSARWSLPSAVFCALGAAVALPLLRPAGLALAALAVLLLVVHRQDRRNAWRYVPEPVTPARLLPPLRPEVQEVVTRTPVPAAPTSKPAVKAVHFRTAAIPVLALPRPRTPVEDRRSHSTQGSQCPAKLAASADGATVSPQLSQSRGRSSERLARAADRTRNRRRSSHVRRTRRVLDTGGCATSGTRPRDRRHDRRLSVRAVGL